MKESSIKTRTLEFIKTKGITMKAFETACGLSSGYVTSMRKGFGSDKLNNVLNAYPELNRDWLLYGEGEMLKSTYTQSVQGSKNFTQTGDVNVVSTEILSKALDEIAEMRKALTQALTTNQSHTDRLLSIVENMSNK